MASDFEIAVEQIHIKLADPTVYKYVFSISLDEHTPLRRVVWIPRTYDSRVPKYINPRIDLRAGEPGQIAKVLYNELWSVEAHVSAESFEELEALREKLLWAVREVLGTDSQPQGGQWTTQDDNIAGVMWAGAEKCVMRFAWSFNIVERTTPSVVKHIETTPELVEEQEPPFVMDAPP